MSAALSKLIREEMLNLDGVRKHAPTRRSTILYAADSPSESVLFVESGFVKIMRREADGKEVLVSIIPPGSIFGEEALFAGGPRLFTAGVMQEGIVYEIPRDLFLGFCDARPEIWRHMTEVSVNRRRDVEQRMAMLCLHDVEARILHCLVNLAFVFGKSTTTGQEYALPLAQSELAGLIGATRETTSTTLNGLARRGLVRLGRRRLVVTSPEAITEAVEQKSVKEVDSLPA